MTSSIIKIALMPFLSNRNLQNRIITFRETSFSEFCRFSVSEICWLWLFRNLLKQSYCLQDSLNACWEVKA